MAAQIFGLELGWVLVFGRAIVTAFRVNKFGGEADVDFEGFVLAGALGDLEGLESLFSKVGESGANGFCFPVLGHDIDYQCELSGSWVTLGICS